MNLNNLPIGAKANVSALTATDSMRRRLLDIGLINGTIVECLGRSPQGDPSAYLIRGAVIAIRNEDCQKIIIDNIMEAKTVEKRYPIQSTQKC